MSYDLFDFVFYNDYFVNKKPWYCSGQGNKQVITMQVYGCIKTKPNTLFPYPPFFLTKKNPGSTLVWGTYDPPQKYEHLR